MNETLNILFAAASVFLFYYLCALYFDIRRQWRLKFYFQTFFEWMKFSRLRHLLRKKLSRKRKILLTRDARIILHSGTESPAV